MIPDGGELLLPIEVPREPIQMDSGGPAKVTRVYSDHADGTFGVGERIRVFVEFTSAVQVVGDAPSLLLRTGCHESSCHTREVQRLRCRATTGKFGVAFAGQQAMNIPWDATTRQFAAYLTRMTAIDNVLVAYSIDENRACTFFGNNITVTFESMNMYGSDGDLPVMTADALNTNGDGTLLGHIHYDPWVTSEAWEIKKGYRAPDREAYFVGNSAPNALEFEYIVQQGDNATRLEYANSDSLARSIAGSRTTKIYNAGTLTAVNPTLPPPGFAGDWERGIGSSLSANNKVTIDVSAPTVTSVTSPHGDGTFGIGEEIFIHVCFSQPVVVTGDPTIVLETGLVDRIVPFSRVLPTDDKIVEFRYIVQSKDTTPDLAYVGTTSLQLNTGTVKRKATTPTTNAVLTLPSNGGAGSLSVNKNIVIDTSDPKVLSITTTSANGVYTAGDTIELAVTFDTPVAVTGTPQLLLNTGSVDLFPGEFIQEAPTVDSSNTIVFPSVDHGLSTALSAGLQFKVGQQILTVSSVKGDAVTMVEVYTGSIVDPTIVGGPSISVRTPGYRPAAYTTGSGTTTLKFTYVVQIGDASLDLDYTSQAALITNGGSIRRQSTSPFTAADLTLPVPGASGSLGSSADIVINTDRPQVLSVTPLTRDGVYRNGEDIFLQVLFDIPVAVQGSAEILLALQTTDAERYAVYVQGSGSRTLVFQYTCRPSDPTVPVFDYAGVMALQPAFGDVLGWIRRSSMSPLLPAILTLPASGLSSKAISIDQSCVAVISITTTHEDGTIGVGEIVDIRVEFSAGVNVIVTNGNPTLMLSTNGIASFLSGSGSNALIFRYVVGASDLSVRLLYLDRFALQLNGAEIRAANGAALAMTLLLPPEQSGLMVTSFIRIDTSPPVVQSVSTRSSREVISVGDQLNIVVRFSSSISVQPALSGAGTPALLLDVGTGSPAAASFVSSDSNSAFFSYTVNAGESTSRLTYSTRTSLKCVNGHGMNKESTQDARYARARIDQGRLYVAWAEQAGSNSKWQIRIKSTDLTRAVALWRSEDGDDVISAINFDTAADAISPFVVPVSSKLYLVWQEANQIRVAMYNPTSKSRAFVERTPATVAGINMNAARSASSPHAAVHDTKLYVAWQEPVTAGGATQIRVAVFNGNDLTPSWTFVDGNLQAAGLNKLASNSARGVKLCSCQASASSSTAYLFATWEEDEATTNTQQIRVAVKMGPDTLPAWRFVDGNGRSGLNLNVAMTGNSPSIACPGGTTVVVAWHERVASGIAQIRVMTFNGNVASPAWTSLSGSTGLNFDSSQHAQNVNIGASDTSTVYVTWEEVDKASQAKQLRAALLASPSSTAQWRFIDGAQRFSTINDDTTHSASEPKLILGSDDDRLYAVWQEASTNSHTQLRASFWSASVGEWQSLCSNCILRQSSQPTITASLLLPAKGTPGAMDFSNAIRVDTAPPSVQYASLVGGASWVSTAPSVTQTVDIFNLASITQGQYRLQYGDSPPTACINWNADAAGPAGSVGYALENIAGLALDVSVTLDSSIFLDGQRYTVTFNFPTVGVKSLRLVSSESGSCASFQCQPASCSAQGVVRVNEGFSPGSHSGIVDIAVRFSAPVVVPTGVPNLALNVGTARAAIFTPRSALQEFDVGVDSASPVIRGAFRLKYGDFSTGVAVGTVVTTDCIDISPIDEDAVQQLQSALESVSALHTIGIISVARSTRENGYRYSVTFRNSGDLLDLVAADASSCTKVSGRTQTIDIRADSEILGGELRVTLGETESVCIPWNVRAQGPTASMQFAISNLLGGRLIPVVVEKDTSMFEHGARYYVSFLMLNDALKPLDAYSDAACTAFTCVGASTACTGLEIVANADFQVARAVSNTISFRYIIQPADDAEKLGYASSSALTGNIVRASASKSLAVSLKLPSQTMLSFTDPSMPLTVAAINSIPSVVQVTCASLDDTYSAGDTLLILVKFSSVVVVEGQPILELNSKGTALYMFGSETDQLTFQYRVRAGESASRFNYASIFALRTPSTPPSRIRCYECASSDIDAELTLPPFAGTMSLVSSCNIVVETTQPTIVSVSSIRADSPVGSDGYGVGDVIDIHVRFSRDVDVIGGASLALNSGGSAMFTYGGYRQVIDVGVDAVLPIISGQFAVVYDGDMSGCIDFDDGDSAAVTSLQSQLLTFDAISEIGLTSVTRSRKKNGYRYVVLFDATNLLKVPLSIELAESDACTPLLPSSPDQVATRSTDVILTFQYVVEENHNALLLDTDAAEMAIVLDDADSKIQRQSRAPVIAADLTLPVAGNAASLGVESNLIVDGTPVRIVDIVSDTVPGTYGVAYPPLASPATVFPGEIQFRLIFSRSIVVVGTPTMEIATGSLQLNGEFLPNRFAKFIEQPQPNEATFLYRIEAGDYSSDLAFVSLNVLDSAIIYCVSSSSHVRASNTLPRRTISSGAAIQIDSNSVPTTVKLSSPHADGTFGVGELISIEVTFSKEVTLLSGLNVDQDWHARYPVALEFQDMIFVMWTESETLIAATQSFLYLRVFSSATLEPVQLTSTTPVNRFPGSLIERVSMTIWKGELYAAWDENGLILCALYQGLVSGYPWVLVPHTGANKNIAMRASDATLLVHNLILVMVWVEKSVPSGSSGLVSQIRVAQRNDDIDAPLWIFQDGDDTHVGLNKNPLMDAKQPTAIVYRGTMYVSWSELNDDGSYEIIIAQRYVQSRDLSFWTYMSPLASNTPAYPFLSSYQPQFAVRRRGFEDIGLLISWYRDTTTSNVTEIVTGQVSDLDWGAATVGSVLQAYPASETANGSYPNAKEGRFVTCGSQVFSSWIETASTSSGRPAALLKLASLNASADASSGWQAAGNLAELNHNSKFDVMDSFLFCSSTSSSAPRVGLVWTEYDGYSIKLRFRHESAPQRVAGSALTTFGEALAGMPKLKLETGTTPAGYAYSVDKSGLTSFTLTFAFIVEEGHVAADLDTFDRNSLILNGAALRDALGQIPDVTVFPRSRDPRSLSFNNDLVIDSSAPVVTSVSSTTPSGSYGVGELFLIDVAFSAPVIVVEGDAASMPRMYLLSDQLHLLDKTQNAALYVRGSGTNVLTFEYTATGADYCDRLDYFDTQSLALYGTDWKIRRQSTFPTTDAVLTLPLPGSPHSLAGSRVISIKPEKPQVLGITSQAPDAIYYPGDQLLIDVLFSLPVVVFGAPVLRLATGSAAGSRALFTSGNGTSTLQFQYDIKPSDITSRLDVIDDREGGSGVVYTTSLMLAGGSQIKRLSTNPTTSAVVVTPVPGMPGSLSFNKNLVIDSVQPSIIDVRSTSIDGTYDVGQSIDILVEFSRTVLVIGVPRIVLNVAGYMKRTAIYIEGSRTRVLLFRYYPAEGDNTDSPLDYFDSNSFIFGPLFSDGGALVEPARVFGLSSHPVISADTQLPIPGPIIRADAVHSLVANNHKIYVRTDGFRVQSVQASVPTGVYSPGERIVLTIAFTDVVTVRGTPVMKLNVDGAATRFASYVSGSGSPRLLFEYVVQMGDHCEALEAASTTAIQLNGGAITDADTRNVPLQLIKPNLPGSLSFETKVAIASVPPSIQQVVCLDASGEYGVGDELRVAVVFSRRVAVSTAGGLPAPSLRLELSNGVRTATFTSGDGTTTLVFTIQLIVGDSASDLEYVGANALTGTVLAAAATPTLAASLMLPAPGSAGSLSAASDIRVTSTAPRVVGVSVIDLNGTYGINNDLTIRVQFSFPVVVVSAPLSSCAVKLAVSASEVRVAPYVGGSMTKTLSFVYTVHPGDRSSRLDYVDPNSLSCSLKQSTKRPEVAAVNTLPPPGSVGSIGFSSLIRIDASAPRVTLVTASLANGVYGVGQVVGIQVVFSSPVFVSSSTPQLRLAISSARATAPRIASYTGGSGTATLSFVYTVQEGDAALPLEYADVDSLSLATSQGSISAAIEGRSSYQTATLRLPVPRSTGSLSNTKNIHIDTLEPPRVISVGSLNPDGVYTAGDKITLSLTFTQPVAVTGAPQLLLDTGNPSSTESEKLASFISGSGSALLLFEYSVQAGDRVDRLDYRGCPLADRVASRTRKWRKHVTCTPASNPLRLSAGDSIKRQATFPATDAVLDLPEVNVWSKIRVETPQNNAIYVDQVEQSTGASKATTSGQSENQFGILEKRVSRLLYSNGVPDHSSTLQVREQKYFIELKRFPRQENNPLYFKSAIGSFLGIFLNGIPFKPPSPVDEVTGTDECGGAIDSAGRYFYAGLPSCYFARIGEPQEPAVVGLFEEPAARPASQMVGYAFDGFPIYGLYDEEGNLPALDECHGRVRKDGQYCYHLVTPQDAASSPFMSCLKGIDAADSTALSVFRYPADIASVEGLPLEELTQFDGFVVDESQESQPTESIWLNPDGVSAIYTSTSVIVRSNGVPTEGTYGPFPSVSNSFAVQAQDYVFRFPRYPAANTKPTALPRDTPIGVMLNGVPFYSYQSNIYGNVMQASSSAYLLMDKCHGLVDEGGDYRYYASPDCLIDAVGGEAPQAPSPLIGYAFDGFPIYGLYTDDGALPTDLDECNGRVGDDGTYRYHTSLTAPYLIGCFRGTPGNGLVAPAENVFRSLAYGHAIRLNTDAPYVSHMFTNKQPGTYVAGETIDVVVQWTVPITVDSTSNKIPSIQIENSTNVAIYDATKSSPSESVFVFSITTDFGEFSHLSRTQIQLNGATIRRLASTPQLDADLNLANAEHNSRFLSKYQLVKGLELSLRGLYHPQASDLRVKLFHGTQSALMFGQCCASSDAFGVPDTVLRVNSDQARVQPINPVSGVGWDYTFRDFMASNLALDGDATATQSSTTSRCFASNAIDGDVHGRISSQRVARTTSRSDQVGWWQLRLVKPSEIGTIRLWMAQPERLPAQVVKLRVDSSDGISAVSGFFTLKFTTPAGRLVETSAINYNAVATVADENPRISTVGIGLGESMQAKLAALEDMPSLFVTRSPADALMSTNGAFAWDITFLGNPRSPSVEVISIGSNDICSGNGIVEITPLYPGDDRDLFEYFEADDRPDTDTPGKVPMIPFWVMLFESTAVLDVDTFEDAYARAIWSFRVGEAFANQSVVTVFPPPGTTAQYVRVVAEHAYAYLTLAEVEVFKERSHQLSDYRSGSPVATQFYPDAKSWSPEEPLAPVFGSMASEGTWILSITDTARQQQYPTYSTHGMGAISDWVLNVTSFGGESRTYYMDVKARVETLPRHGKLYVALNGTERDHADFDGNGVLDPLEADAFLQRYALSYGVLPDGTRSRALVSFMAGYESYGGIEIVADPSERQKVMPSLCDRACYETRGIDPFMFPGTTGDVGLKLMVVRDDRIVRYVPNTDFRGTDAFTYSIWIGSERSVVKGTVWLSVDSCQDRECIMANSFVHRSN